MRREGFSLIEALVALAIASMVLMAILELQIQMARGQRRAEAAIEQVQEQENAIALVRDINPTEQPQGNVEMSRGAAVVWQARPVGQPRIGVGFPVGNGPYELQLYEVTVTIQRPQGSSPRPLVFERLGWRRLDGTD